MKTIAVITLFATISLGAALPAAAQFTTTPPSTTPTPDCQYNCDGDGPEDDDGATEVGDPWFPPKPECVDDCGSGGGDGPGDGDEPGEPGQPGQPGQPGGSQALLGGECGDKLGSLRRVTPAQIQSVGFDSLVDVVPVCRSKSLAAVQEDVATLRSGIAGNAVLDRELDREGFDPSQVVGVIVNGPAVTLYVHQL